LTPAYGPDDVMIVLVAMPDRSVVRFQGMLLAEEGLAAMRSQRGKVGEHELWSTWVQQGELDDWLASMPAALEVRVVDRYAFQPDSDKGVEARA